MLHQVSRRLVNRYKVIFTEDIKIKAMVKKDGSAASKEFNRKLYNCGWDMFTGFLAYKAKMESRIYRKVPKDFPSTQQCCRCSKPNKYMKPYSGRIFACVKCGLFINRDLNAAIIAHHAISMVLAKGA